MSQRILGIGDLPSSGLLTQQDVDLDLETLVYADGGSQGNGSAAQVAYGSFLVDGEVEPHRLTFGNCTNNEAEYRALIGALDYCQQKGILYPYVRMDSLLVVNQVNQTWACRKVHLMPLLSKVWELVAVFRSFRLEWRDRDELVAFLGH